MAQMTIEEQNEMIIRSRFPVDRPITKSDHRIGKGVNQELAASIIEHRKHNGLSSKIQLIRNFVRTRPFIRTIICKTQVA